MRTLLLQARVTEAWQVNPATSISFPERFPWNLLWLLRRIDDLHKSELGGGPTFLPGMKGLQPPLCRDSESQPLRFWRSGTGPPSLSSRQGCAGPGQGSQGKSGASSPLSSFASSGPPALKRRQPRQDGSRFPASAA